jgi:UDP-2-acetamido-3-amino-2,3-dideoxy-glucuronate N-acetyltransferase
VPEKSYFVHESSYVDENVEIGEGTKIWHFSHIQSGARIGKSCSIGQNVNIGNNVIIGHNVKIQNNVSVYEGVELEDYVFCGPSMVFTNILNPRSEFPQRGSKFYKKTVVKRGASLGANCTIVCGNTIGKSAFVGAGAVVTKDVPDFALVVGNPARIKGWVCSCGGKLTFSGKNSNENTICERCGMRFLKKGSIIAKEV